MQYQLLLNYSSLELPLIGVMEPVLVLGIGHSDRIVFQLIFETYESKALNSYSLAAFSSAAMKFL